MCRRSKADAIFSGGGKKSYSHEGWAWRFYIPEHLQFRALNNLLDHIAAVIMPWIDVISGRLGRDDCALSMMDSSTSKRWLKRSNFTKLTDDPVQVIVRLEVCRRQAIRMMRNGIKDYSQWFPGKDNNISDTLSLNDDWKDKELTHILRNFIPSQ
eukprot:10524181-Ditylum_brightwellii.AAC.1